MKIENIFREQLERVEQAKEEEKKNASQERQASIASLKEKVAKLRELSLAWQGQFEVTGEQIKEFKKASGDVTEVFNKYKGEGLVKEGKREHFIAAVKAGEYGQEVAEEGDSEINIREQKRKEVKAAIAKRKGVSAEERPQTLAEIRKAIKQELPEEVAESINFSLKAVNKENVGYTIERAVLGIEDEIKGLVKEAVADRHKNGSVELLPQDLEDMKVLGKKEIGEIILEQANNLIEKKRAKEFGEVELLEKDTNEMRSLERTIEQLKVDIERMVKGLIYTNIINEFVRPFTDKESRAQVANNLRNIAEEFGKVFSQQAIIKILGEKPERFTDGNKTEIFITIRDFDQEFSGAIAKKRDEIQETMGQRGGDKTRADLISALQDELIGIKNKAAAKVQELQKKPDEKKYIINPQADKLANKQNEWQKSTRWDKKDIDKYFFEKKGNINTIASREEDLAEKTLDKNFLVLEIKEAEAENGEVYNKVKDYYERAKKMKEEAEQVEKAMGRYGYEFTFQEEEPFLIMPKLNEEIKELEENKKEKQGAIDEQNKIIKDNQGAINTVKSFGRSKKAIEAATEAVAKLAGDIKYIDAEIEKIKQSEQKIREKLAGFFAVIPKEWLNNKKLSQAIFKEYGEAHVLTSVAFKLENRHKDFGIISDEDVKIHRELGLQRGVLGQAEQAEEQARKSLAGAKTEAANFEKEYLG